MLSNYSEIINAILTALTIISISYSIFIKLKNVGLRNEINVLNEDLHKNELVLENINKKIDNLRINNHEHRKKLNLVKELAHQNKCKDILNFLENETKKSYNDIRVSDSSRISIIANSIQDSCLKYNINYKYYIGNASMILPVDFSDLHSIIVNILENSVNVLKNKDNGKAYIRMNIYDDPVGYYIEILNNGPKVDNTKEIFKKGYTKSNDASRGLGLYICKKIIKKYTGNIYVESNDINTKFTVIIPKI